MPYPKVTTLLHPHTHLDHMQMRVITTRHREQYTVRVSRFDRQGFTAQGLPSWVEGDEYEATTLNDEGLAQLEHERFARIYQGVLCPTCQGAEPVMMHDWRGESDWWECSLCSSGWWSWADAQAHDAEHKPQLLASAEILKRQLQARLERLATEPALSTTRLDQGFSLDDFRPGLYQLALGWPGELLIWLVGIDHLGCQLRFMAYQEGLLDDAWNMPFAQPEQAIFYAQELAHLGFGRGCHLVKSLSYRDLAYVQVPLTLP